MLWPTGERESASASWFCFPGTHLATNMNLVIWSLKRRGFIQRIFVKDWYQRPMVRDEVEGGKAFDELPTFFHGPGGC